MNKNELVRQLTGYIELMQDSGVNKLSANLKRKSLTGNLVENKVDVDTQKLSLDFSFALSSIESTFANCQNCHLESSRINVVFGDGNPKADLVFVGEAPGREEDLKGEPFVGKAGQLLTKIIEAIGLKREDVYICNVVKCRPPENRNPLPEEIEACKPILLRQLEVIKPKAICALGKFAAQTLLNTETSISALRGTFRDYYNIPLMPTYHPAYLLRNPSMKRAVWEDVKLIKKRLNSQ